MERFGRRLVHRHSDHDFGHLPGSRNGHHRIHSDGDGNLYQRRIEVGRLADQGQPPARGNDIFSSPSNGRKQLQPSLD
jgi:hypothetical protein